MRAPCESISPPAGSEVPCGKEAQPWILVATILASSMAFIDSTVVNVALPALQANFHAGVVDVQWVVASYGLFQHASWRWVFFINLPFAAAVIAISAWRIPESRSTVAGRVDWPGAILATLALGGMVFGFIESTNLGWKDPLVFGSLISAMGCLIVF